MVKKVIALVAHDNCKADLIEWAKWNSEVLLPLEIVCTGTTGRMIEKMISEQHPNEKPSITCLQSGPLGGDFQLGALIVDKKINCMIFLWDPTEPHPHDVDVKALLRIAVLHNIPFACNRATADYLISSPLFHEDYEPKETDFDSYINRKIEIPEKTSLDSSSREKNV